MSLVQQFNAFVLLNVRPAGTAIKCVATGKAKVMTAFASYKKLEHAHDVRIMVVTYSYGRSLQASQ